MNFGQQHFAGAVPIMEAVVSLKSAYWREFNMAPLVRGVSPGDDVSLMTVASGCRNVHYFLEDKTHASM